MIGMVSCGWHESGGPWGGEYSSSFTLKIIDEGKEKEDSIVKKMNKLLTAIYHRKNFFLLPKKYLRGINYFCD